MSTREALLKLGKQADLRARKLAQGSLSYYEYFIKGHDYAQEIQESGWSIDLGRYEVRGLDSTNMYYVFCGVCGTTMAIPMLGYPSLPYVLEVHTKNCSHENDSSKAKPH